MNTRTMMAKAIESERRVNECKDAGTHPTRSGKLEHRVLGGESVEMERCAVCDLLIARDASTWQQPQLSGDEIVKAWRNEPTAYGVTAFDAAQGRGDRPETR